MITNKTPLPGMILLIYTQGHYSLRNSSFTYGTRDVEYHQQPINCAALRHPVHSLRFTYVAAGILSLSHPQAIAGHNSTVAPPLSRIMSHPAMDPPAGVVADLENPKDVIWTINLVTQSLTLSICSFFVFTRVLQRFRMPGWLLSVDECALRASLA